MSEVHHIHQDPDAQRMLVQFNKGVNMLETFFTEFNEKRRAIGDAQIGDWCFYQLRMSLSVVLKLADVLTDANKARVLEENRVAKEIEKQKAAAERAAEKEAVEKKKKEDAERKRADAEKKAADNKREYEEKLEEEKLKQERATRLKAERATTKKLEKEAEAAAKTTTTRKGRGGGGRGSSAPRTPRKVIEATNGSPMLPVWLAEAEHFEETCRVNCGERYVWMKAEVDNKNAGKDPDTNKPWKWTTWAERHIKRTLRDVQKCMAEYKQALSSSDNDDTSSTKKSA